MGECKVNVPESNNTPPLCLSVAATLVGHLLHMMLIYIYWEIYCLLPVLWTNVKLGAAWWQWCCQCCTSKCQSLCAWYPQSDKKPLIPRVEVHKWTWHWHSNWRPTLSLTIDPRPFGIIGDSVTMDWSTELAAGVPLAWFYSPILFYEAKIVRNHDIKLLQFWYTLFAESVVWQLPLLEFLWPVKEANIPQIQKMAHLL